MSRNYIISLLSSLGVIKQPEFIIRRIDQVPLPENIEDKELYVVKSGHKFKWMCFRCPGGCGDVINLSMSKKRRPRWILAFDWLGRVTVQPSIHQLNQCKCHFFIRNSKVDWCYGGKPNQNIIKPIQSSIRSDIASGINEKI